jgi:peptide deformylase
MKILTYPHPTLDQKADLVSLPLDPKTQELIRNMFATVDGQGIGLAAPQVGVSKQICIIHLDPEIATKKDKDLDIVMINPNITFYSEVETLMIEGCLSFPEQYYEIVRPANISVEFETISNLKEFLDGKKAQTKKKTLMASGWMSRVVQHEVDHLNGDLFIHKGGKKLEPETVNQDLVVE